MRCWILAKRPTPPLSLMKDIPEYEGLYAVS
jgi:hypothetical protein